MIRCACLISSFSFWMILPVFGLPENDEAGIHESIQNISSLIGKKRFSEAIEDAKKAAARFPAQRPFVLLLAKAYLLDNNPVWALRTLYAWTAEHPSDEETVSWMAWIHLQIGQIKSAETQSMRFTNSEAASLVTRDYLFTAYLEYAGNHPSEARQNFKKAVGGVFAFPEDDVLAKQLGGALFPQWRGKYSLYYDFIAGYSARPALVSAFGENVEAQGSAFTGLTSSFRLDPLLTHPLRPIFTCQQSFLYYGDHQGPEPPSENSFFFPEFRLDLVWSLGNFKPVTSYACGAYLLNRAYLHPAQDTLWFESLLPKKSHWFHEYHRFEMDLAIARNLVVIGAFGKRWFNPMGRTRIENELTAVYRLPPLFRMETATALSGRYYPAQNNRYDITGGTLLLSMAHEAAPGWAASLNVAGSWDNYPRSSGFFHENHHRLDWLYLIKLGIHYEWLETIGFYGQYEFSSRKSNVSTERLDYDYKDHRFQLGIRGAFHAGVCPAPEKTENPERRITLPYSAVPGAADMMGPVRDLLRHREELRRGSTCLN